MEFAFLIYHFISHLSYMPSYIRYILSIWLLHGRAAKFIRQNSEAKIFWSVFGTDAENLKHCHMPNKNASAGTALDMCFLHETWNENIRT